MGQGASFRTTRWSLVLSTRGSTVEAKRALDELCVTYWYPLYVHAMRSGQSDGEAHETVQGFVAQLLEGGGLDRAWAQELIAAATSRLRLDYMAGGLSSFASRGRARGVPVAGHQISNLGIPL